MALALWSVYILYAIIQEYLMFKVYKKALKSSLVAFNALIFGLTHLLGCTTYMWLYSIPIPALFGKTQL
jgi:hypothetical protein